jgi:hypothetical protein
MKRVRVTFDISSYWHAGTGRGAGPELDARCCRSAAGLPTLPGRTVRGLLRDALALAVEVGEVDRAGWPEGDPVRWCFGTGLEAPAVGEGTPDRVETLEEARFRTQAGKLRFTSAVLGTTEVEARGWEAWASQAEGVVDHLFRPFASTKIAEDGRAAEHTLRAIEVAVPLTLHAEVSGPDGPEPDWRAAITAAARFVRGLGSHRNRGLGRVQVSVEEVR